MDVFSAGCVIAELFRDGAPLFTLSQLFKYREGELHTDGLLSSVEDVGVRVSHTWSRGVSMLWL
jgi:phosphoinositide-3-kinase regulatory subunit 4